MILFFGLSTTRADYFERMTAGETLLEKYDWLQKMKPFSKVFI